MVRSPDVHESQPVRVERTDLTFRNIVAVIGVLACGLCVAGAVEMCLITTEDLRASRQETFWKDEELNRPPARPRLERLEFDSSQVREADKNSDRRLQSRSGPMAGQSPNPIPIDDAIQKIMSEAATSSDTSLDYTGNSGGQLRVGDSNSGRISQECQP